MDARRSHVERETLILDAKLGILHSQQKQVSALLASITTQYGELSQQRKALNDSLIPLYLLPNELLCAIFNLVIDSSPPPPPDALADIVPLRLSQISSRLRAVALSQPNLWRRLVLQPSDTDDHPRAITRQFMSRLGHVPRVDTFYYNNSAAKEETQPSRLLILIRLPPISSLTIDAESSAIHDLASHLSLGLIAGLRALSSLTLTMRRASLAGLSALDRRLAYHRTRANPPVPQDLLLHLTHLKLKDVPLSAIPVTPMCRLQDVTIEFTCVFDFARSNPNELRTPASYTSNHQIARFFRCAPNIKQLALLDAGPFFVKPLNPTLDVEEFWSQPASWREEPNEVPPVHLSGLRELEYTSVHGQALYHFLSFFPSPALEELRIDILETHPNPGRLVRRGPRSLVDDNMLPENMNNMLSFVNLPSLRTVRAETASGECWKYTFHRILMPALETLVLENTSFTQPREKCVHQAVGLCHECQTPYASLMRADNIFRDPRLVTLRRLELVGVDVERDVADSWIGYVPALRELVCDYTQGADLVLNALTPRGALVPCPALQSVELYACNDVHLGQSLTRLAEGKSEASERPTGTTMINGRKVKQLKRVQRAGGTKTVAKIQAIKVEACTSFSEQHAKDLEGLGVDVDWMGLLWVVDDS